MTCEHSFSQYTLYIWIFYEYNRYYQLLLNFIFSNSKIEFKQMHLNQLITYFECLLFKYLLVKLLYQIKETITNRILFIIFIIVRSAIQCIEIYPYVPGNAMLSLMKHEFLHYIKNVTFIFNMVTSNLNIEHGSSLFFFLLGSIDIY